MLRKLRLALHKGEELRFLSHLDYASAIERMIRRSGIKMAYSEGFNPHMKISFSSALALGITASAEYCDMDVLEEGSLEELMGRLSQAAPKGLEVLDGRFMPDKVKKMMAICNYAVYEVTGPMTDVANWDALLEPFNSAEEVLYEKVTPKKTRTIDVKHFIKEPLVAKVDGDRVTIRMAIGVYPEGTMKPGDMWKLGKDQYGWPVTDSYSIHRKAILIETEGTCITPLEVE